MAVSAGADFVGARHTLDSSQPSLDSSQSCACVLLHMVFLSVNHGRSTQSQLHSRMSNCCHAHFPPAGMIMWPKAKRSVSDNTARAIAEAAKDAGALPVGVFVDEDPSTIIQRCAGQTLNVVAI